MVTDRLTELLETFETVKRQEELLIAKRRELATQIVEAFGHKEIDSSHTYKEVPGFRVTIKVPLNSRMNWEKWEQIEDVFIDGDEDFRPVEMKPALLEPGVKWLHYNRPDLYARLAEALTVTPGMPQVKVERIEVAV